MLEPARVNLPPNDPRTMHGSGEAQPRQMVRRGVREPLEWIPHLTKELLSLSIVAHHINRARQ